MNTTIESPVPAPVATPKRKRHIFRWVFLAIQGLMLIWVISAGASGSGQPTDCNSLSAEVCNDAQNVGAGIAVVLLIVFWVIIDIIVGFTYLVMKLSSRKD